MITETGKVIATKGDQVWVQTIRASACQSCSARSGCGQRALASVSGGRANQILVANTINARVGDDVTIGIEERALLGASMRVYALPLVAMVLATIAGHNLTGGSDLGAMLGAVAGLGGGFVLTRLFTDRRDGYEPRLLRRNRISSETCP
ncbi:SoxR reducing system RseC family protein [Marinobacter pelagius]|uniref:SoxR reducing system RseC family protein n=1 Tax=Marinobacter sp. C7 TaxID=2951363 RepID=UPI001EF0C5BC|nr:SoxR reducing system RseC family protein [Marinobacter sp. C7]MCG7201123.1 SoxR reducing system RseC family protein [Marinobacter sp. C7]